ncbi:hypothetical protein CCACVL1_11544, partial [Corchorus capsularis]
LGTQIPATSMVAIAGLPPPIWNNDTNPWIAQSKGIKTCHTSASSGLR